MIRAKLKKRPLRYTDENGNVKRCAETINWVKYLARKKPVDAQKEEDEKFLDACIKYAVELAHVYALNSVEVFLSTKSLHFNYVKRSTLYTCIIPKSLIVRTNIVAPHMEKCVRVNLIREIKRKKQSVKNAKDASLRSVLPTYGRGWLPVYAASSTSMT